MPAWRAALLLALLLVLPATGPLRAAGDGLADLTPGSPAAGIYGSNHLSLLPDKAVLVYDYRYDGSLLERPVDDDVLLDFTRHGGDAGFDVDASLFPKTRGLSIGPIAATAANPLLLIFFQRDATQMSGGTGGSQHYFRNSIRRALQTPDADSARDITITVGGVDLAATEITVRPFVQDPNRARLRAFADKTYRFVVSAAVPGGIYQVQAETPAESGGGVLLRETYRFREMRP